MIKKLIVGAILLLALLAALAIPFSIAHAQSSNQITSNNLINPFAYTPDTITLGTKSQYSSKRDFNISSKLSLYQDYGAGKEVILNANGLYDDTWATTSTVTQQYSGRVDELNPMSTNYGQVVTLGESHDNTQGVRFNSFWGSGLCYQSGSLTKKNYVMVAAEGGGSFTNYYRPGINQHSGAAYFLMSDTNNFKRVVVSIGSSLTLPLPNTAAWQTALDASVSYRVGTNFAITFSSIYDYYAIAPKGFDNNAVETSLGVTYRFLRKDDK